MKHAFDTARISELIVEAADTLILPRYKLLKTHEIDTKSGPNDLVTIADKEAEEFLNREITALYPDSVLIGEESISEGRKSLDSLMIKDKVIWVTDPVDGTYNFVHGNREFGVMLAAVYNGVVVQGWIYDVLGRKMMVAEHGAGAFFDGVRLKTAAPKPLSELVGYVGMKYMPEPVRPFLIENKPKVKKAFSLSCAAHEYLAIIQGNADFGIYSRVKAWDHLAGTLAVREAGGTATLWGGGEYYPSFGGHGVLAASCKDVEAEIRHTFVDNFMKILKPAA
jgi:fructose-1,6-bisphosphatase/inositol monophosphatase family enzyme